MSSNNAEHRECKRHGWTKFRRETTNRWRCVACSTLYRRNGRRRNKERLVQEFGGKCMCCGYDKCFAALQFHHIDPSTKEFSVGAVQVSQSLESLRREASKCILLCANCHAEKHYYGVI